MSDASKHATRKVGERLEWTGEKDQDGTPVAPTAEDYTRLGAKAFLEHQRWVMEQKRVAADKRRAEERFEQFKERFVEAGGDPTDAGSAYKAKLGEEAADLAYRSAEAGRAAVRSQVKGAV